MLLSRLEKRLDDLEAANDKFVKKFKTNDAKIVADLVLKEAENAKKIQALEKRVDSLFAKPKNETLSKELRPLKAAGNFINNTNCCSKVMFASTGKADEIHASKLGLFNFLRMNGSRPLFDHGIHANSYKLWYLERKNQWIVGRDPGTDRGWLYVGSNATCPEDTPSLWRYDRGSSRGWADDPALTVQCANL